VYEKLKGSYEKLKRIYIAPIGNLDVIREERDVKRDEDKVVGLENRIRMTLVELLSI
jgi:hypothetical protein